MIETNKKYIHWDYYLTIEDDLKTIARYIDFNADNFNTYSIELARLLQITCSEIDVVCKLLCEKLESSSQCDNINKYRITILNNLPDIVNQSIYSKRYGLTLNPFVNWKDGQNPDWWHSYNQVKHYRDTSFSKANLQNVLNSVAALQLVVLYYYLGESINKDKRNIKSLFHDISNNSKESEVFTLSSDYYYHRLVVNT